MLGLSSLPAANATDDIVAKKIKRTCNLSAFDWSNGPDMVVSCFHSLESTGYRNLAPLTGQARKVCA